MLFSELPRKPSCVIDATRFGLSADLPTCQGFVTNDVPEDLRAFVPQIDSNYVFSENAYRTVAAWLEHGADCPLFVSGPAGSGKTSLAMQVAARLSLPVFDFTARLRMDVRELIGRWVMESDGMTFRDGPAVRAWRSGGIFLVNEFSAAPPEAWVSANSLLERLPIFIPETGELVEPHPMTRIIATDNTRGLSNDQDAGYLGRSLQDRSVMDRTWNLRLEGLSWEEEKRLLLATVPVNFPRIPDAVARRAAELWPRSPRTPKRRRAKRSWASRARCRRSATACSSASSRSPSCSSRAGFRPCATKRPPCARWRPSRGSRLRKLWTILPGVPFCSLRSSGGARGCSTSRKKSVDAMSAGRLREAAAGKTANGRLRLTKLLSRPGWPERPRSERGLSDSSVPASPSVRAVISGIGGFSP